MIKINFDNIFDRFQNLLQLDIKYFFRTGVLNFAQQLIGIFCGLIISYFFGHYTSKKIFGEYNLLISILGLLTLLTLPGIDEYLVRSISQKYESSYFRAVKVKFLLSLLGSLVLLGLAFTYYQRDQAHIALALLVSSLLFPFYHAFQLYIEYFTAKMEFKVIAIVISVSSILTTFLITTSIMFLKSLYLIVLAFLLGTIIPSFVGFRHSLNKINKSKRHDKNLIPYSLFITILSAFPWSTGYIGQIILATYLGTESLAVFTVASKLPIYVQKNLFVFHKPITAKLAHQSNKSHLITLKRHSSKLIFWGFLLALPIYLFSPVIIQFIFSTNYVDSIPLARIMSLSVIPLPLTWVTSDIITFQKTTKLRAYAVFIQNVIKIALYFILIPKFKIIGLVFVFIIDRYVSLIIDLLVVYFHNKTK